MARKPAFFENRAREMCIATGADPDSRVFKDGSERGQPAWCSFAEAAQSELKLLNVKETFKTVTGQPEEYRDAPLHIMGTHDESTILQMRNCMSVGNVVAGALQADGHLGYSQPVGGVIAYRDQISISGVGYDIACGNKAVKLDVVYGDIAGNLPLIADDIANNISFGVGRKNPERVEHELFDYKDQWEACGMSYYRKQAQDALGTCGSGNHYVDIMIERIPDVDLYNSPVWIGVHFGSRGLGHTIATKHLKEAGAKDSVHALPTVVDVHSDLGQSYIAGMHLAGGYAYAGRNWVVEKIRSMIGGNVISAIHNHHNYAWEENGLWVVRKGATPAWPGEQGFVGGSMGDDAVILQGKLSNSGPVNLHSTVHGAGRLFSRNEAKRRFTKTAMNSWIKERGVHLRGADLDESPMAYRRLSEVLAAQGDTIEIIHVLSPVIVVMAGNDIDDPWKD